MREIVRVRTLRDLRRFVDLPYRIYRDDPHWIAPLRRDERRRLTARHNPFLQHAAITPWVAMEDGRATGRIAAVDDRLHNETHKEAVTWFGFFEASDEATAAELLAAVEHHAESIRSTTVRGPVNPSLHESAGLLIGPFDADPFVLMPYNPPAYPAFVERAGYRKAKDLLAWNIDARAPLPPTIRRLAVRAARRAGLSVRPVNVAALDRDLQTVQAIYRAAWRDNWGFVPPTDAEFRQLAADLRPVVDPELVLIVELDGEAVACAVAIPDINQVLKRMRGRLLPVGWIHFLRRRRIVTRLRVVMLGVLPAARRLGLYPLLIAELHRRAGAGGYVEAELSWTLEDNDSVNAGIAAAGAQRSATYRLYEKPVG